MKERREHTKQIIEQLPEYAILTTFVQEYRALHGLRWVDLRIYSTEEGSCIAQGENNNLLMALCTASEWYAEWLKLLDKEFNNAYVLLQEVIAAVEYAARRNPNLYVKTNTELQRSSMN